MRIYKHIPKGARIWFRSKDFNSNTPELWTNSNISYKSLQKYKKISGLEWYIMGDISIQENETTSYKGYLKYIKAKK